MRLAFLFLSIYLCKSAVALETQFHKEALKLLVKSYSKDVCEIEDDMGANAELYLDTAISVYKECEYLSPKHRSNLSMIRNIISTSVGYSNCVNTVTINNEVQMCEAHSISDLKRAIDERHWIAVFSCIEDIAVLAQKFLIRSKDKSLVEIAKGKATDPSTPKNLRSALLAPLADSEDKELMQWVLKQKDFKGSARDELVKRQVKKVLGNDSVHKALSLINEYLKPGYSAYISASKDVFNYYFQREDFENCRKILTGHFSRGYSDYNQLARKIFNYYLGQANVVMAENTLRKHFAKGYSASDELVGVLVRYLMEQNLYDEALEIAKKNMNTGYTAHNKMEKQILRRQIEFLKGNR
jgi:hypothetical protein